MYYNYIITMLVRLFNPLRQNQVYYKSSNNFIKVPHKYIWIKSKTVYLMTNINTFGHSFENHPILIYPFERCISFLDKLLNRLFLTLS